MENVLTIQEVAGQFRVSKKTVKSWIAAGELTAINVGKAGAKYGCWRITEASLVAFQRKRQKITG